MRVDGTLPDNAYGAVNVVYRATRSDGSELVRTAPLAPEHGEFSTTFKLGHADRHLGKGTVTVDFLGDSAYQAARTTVPVPAA
jgi:hypothetical protein